MTTKIVVRIDTVSLIIDLSVADWNYSAIALVYSRRHRIDTFQRGIKFNMESHSFRRYGIRAALTLAVLIPTSSLSGANVVQLSDDTTRVADPKLPGGGASISFKLMQNGNANVIVEVLDESGRVVATVSQQAIHGQNEQINLFWDGRNETGDFVDLGVYSIRIREAAGQFAAVQYKLHVIRLGIVEVAALESVRGNDEFQMVYFMQGDEFRFFLTPSTHEFSLGAGANSVSDLDLDNGDPRPIPPIHEATNRPVMDGSGLATAGYNYPLCYQRDATPRLRITMGKSATSASGVSSQTVFPAGGHEIRLQAGLGTAVLSTSPPIGGNRMVVIDGPRLPTSVTRIDHQIGFSWQYHVPETGRWVTIPGSLLIPLRFYTVLRGPQFEGERNGNQYKGPWVEVADHFFDWSRMAQQPIQDDHDLIFAFVKGFFGQSTHATQPFENIAYDPQTEFAKNGTLDLSRLLNGDGNVRFANCVDVMATTLAMLSMMGAENLKGFATGGMDLRAVRAIGTPNYSLDLFGIAHSHSFDVHCVVSADNGATIIDACLQVDEDGNPDALPGMPGWNIKREFAGPQGYDILSSSNGLQKHEMQTPLLR